jgi:hypothetical protein
MTTRKDAKNPLAPQAQPQVLQSGTVNTDHLPPQRPKKSMTKTVRPPLEGMSLTTFIYGLVALAALYRDHHGLEHPRRVQDEPHRERDRRRQGRDEGQDPRLCRQPWQRECERERCYPCGMCAV